MSNLKERLGAAIKEALDAQASYVSACDTGMRGDIDDAEARLDLATDAVDVLLDEVGALEGGKP